MTAIDGTDVVLAADTICLHGDSVDAAARVLEVRVALEAAGVAVRALDR